MLKNFKKIKYEICLQRTENYKSTNNKNINFFNLLESFETLLNTVSCFQFD